MKLFKIRFKYLIPCIIIREYLYKVFHLDSFQMNLLILMLTIKVIQNFATIISLYTFVYGFLTYPNPMYIVSINLLLGLDKNKRFVLMQPRYKTRVDNIGYYLLGFDLPLPSSDNNELSSS